MGYLLPQLLTANYTERLRRKMPFVLMMAGVERICYPLIALAIWWLAGPAPALAVTAMLILRAISAWAGGMGIPAWYDLIAKVIPLQKRGLFSGIGNGLGALLGIAGAALAGQILTRWAFPTNFALCFLLASLILGISLWSFSLTREPDSPTVKAHLNFGDYLRRLPTVLRRDHNYLRFLVSRSIVLMGGMATGFYIVYGAERFGVGEKEVGILTALLVSSQAAANLLWGPMGDRMGHKRVLCGEAFLTALAAAVAYLAAAPLWLWGTFVFLGAATAASAVSSLNIILEFCAPEDRPTYIGLTNTILAPFSMLAPIFGGLLATSVGYREMFVVAAFAAAVGGLLMALWVHEPRHAQEGQLAPLAE